MERTEDRVKLQTHFYTHFPGLLIISAKQNTELPDCHWREVVLRTPGWVEQISSFSSMSREAGRRVMDLLSTRKVKYFQHFDSEQEMRINILI